MARKCSNWLLSLRDYSEETETPLHFWTWAGLFVLSAAVQRKVWTPFGQKKLFPNLYVMIIAPPGLARKASPLTFAKKVLGDIQMPIFVDSPSKRAFTKHLDSLSKRCHFTLNIEGVQVSQAQSPLSCISPELSSFFALDIKGMVEILTDIYDCPDTWDYMTAGSGEDKIISPYITCLFASTPMWIAGNLPQEAIGGGFTRRCVIVYGDQAKKSISLPPPPEDKIYRAMVQDLQQIANLKGPVEWTPAAFDIYDQWYQTLKEKLKMVSDERIQPFLSEVHSIAIKTAILAHIAKSDQLFIEPEDMLLSIGLLEKVIETAGKAFSSHGRSLSAIDTDRVMNQIAISKTTTLAELLRFNYRNTDKTQMAQILDTLEGMDRIKRVCDTNGRVTIIWKGGKE